MSNLSRIYSHKKGREIWVDKNKYEHLTSATYSSENGTRVHAPCKHGRTISFEFEMGRNEEKFYYLGEDHQWLPTYDATVAIEYKSPIYRSMRGLEKLFQTIEEKSPCMSGAGSHINFGHTKLTRPRMNYIRDNFEVLFTPINSYLENLPSDTVRAFFGRPFSDWAEPINFSDAYCHRNWINLQHKDWIECRLPKFRNARQYMNCAKFCWEFLDILIKGTGLALTSQDAVAELQKCSMRLKWCMERWIKSIA